MRSITVRATLRFTDGGHRINLSHAHTVSEVSRWTNAEHDDVCFRLAMIAHIARPILEDQVGRKVERDTLYVLRAAIMSGCAGIVEQPIEIDVVDPA